MGNKISFFLLFIITVVTSSCKTAKIILDVPSDVSNHATKIGVSGIRGKGLPGSKRPLKFEQEFTGTFKDGWVVTSDIFDKTPGGIFSAEAVKRGLLSNMGIEINNVTSKKTDKYQFTVSDSKNSIIAFCYQKYLGKSINYNIKNRIDFSTATNEASSFVASFLYETGLEKSEWFLELKYDRETPGGIVATNLREGMAIEKGFLANKTDTIHIKPLFIKRNAEKIAEKSIVKSFEIVGGYEFMYDKKTIGIVDLFNPSIWFFAESNTKFKSLVASAATALLLRRR
jgi:hypothetical protein